METPNAKPLMAHPAYIAGEIAAVRCLVLALLEASGADHQEFAHRALHHLDTERTAFLQSHMPEPYEKALAIEEQKIRLMFLD